MDRGTAWLTRREAAECDVEKFFRRRRCLAEKGRRVVVEIPCRLSANTFPHSLGHVEPGCGVWCGGFRCAGP